MRRKRRGIAASRSRRRTEVCCTAFGTEDVYRSTREYAEHRPPEGDQLEAQAIVANGCGKPQPSRSIHFTRQRRITTVSNPRSGLASGPGLGVCTMRMAVMWFVDPPRNVCRKRRSQSCRWSERPPRGAVADVRTPSHSFAACARASIGNDRDP